MSATVTIEAFAVYICDSCGFQTADRRPVESGTAHAQVEAMIFGARIREGWTVSETNRLLCPQCHETHLRDTRRSLRQ